MSQIKSILKKASSILPDKFYLSLLVRIRLGYRMNWKHPVTFNQKLQWLKVHDRNPEYTTLVDKFEVKRFVAQNFGSNLIIKNYGIWDRFDDIDFSTLPDQFVLKTTHDSGGVVVCSDKSKFDKVEAKQILETSLNTDYYKVWREWPYRNVQRRILAEKYLEGSDHQLRDYKIHCFNGVPKIVLVCQNRFSKDGLTEDFFDTNWKHLNIARAAHPNSSELVQRPSRLDEMINMSKKLSQNKRFVRVDFYEVSGRLFFGEMTFYPASGLEHFSPESVDYAWGDMLFL